MANNDTFTIMKDTFGKEGSDEKCEGLTLIIDGKLKEVFDTIVSNSDNFEDYTSVLSEAVIHGLNYIRKNRM